MKSSKLSLVLLSWHFLGAPAETLPPQCAHNAHQILVDQAPLCFAEYVHSRTPTSETFSHPIWSHKPFCISKSGVEYCTQTASDVRNGHGLSIISTPKAAKAISLAFSHTQNARIVSEDKLDVRNIPGKGFGLITLQQIKRGQTILLDSPRIIASAEFPAHVLQAQGASLFQEAVARLPSSDRDSVLNLDKSLGGTDIEDIMKTNAFACQLHDGTEGDAYMCLFPSVARINHACRPSAHARFIPKTLLMEVKALRDIEAGEEISISYGRIDLKYAERQRLYREGWNFTCTCDLCMANQYEIVGSDQRRARFAQLRSKLEHLTPETYDAEQIVAWEKEIMELSSREGFDVLLAADYERLAYVYAGYGMVKDAKLWANNAKKNLLEWTVVDGGPDNELRRIEELLGELT